MLARVVRSFTKNFGLVGRATFTIKTGKEDGGNPLENAGIDTPSENPKSVPEFPGEGGSNNEHYNRKERSFPSDEGYNNDTNKPYGQRYSRNNYNRRTQGYNQNEGEDSGDNQRSYQRRDNRDQENGYPQRNYQQRDQEGYQRGYQRRDQEGYQRGYQQRGEGGYQQRDQRGEGGYRSNWTDRRRQPDQQGETQRYNNYNKDESKNLRNEHETYGERKGQQEGYERRRGSNWVDRNAGEQEKTSKESEINYSNNNSDNLEDDVTNTQKYK